METITYNNYEFLKFNIGKAVFIFSTAKGELNFNKNSVEGLNNLEQLKTWFNLKDIGFLSQIHSDTVHIYDGSIVDGDSIMTKENNIGVGVFTADCVPVLLYDSCNNIIASVHSGWKGTYKKIVAKTINEMVATYSTKPSDIFAIIGPHIRDCCYEVSQELKEKFNTPWAFNGRKLNMEKLIINSMIDLGVLENNIQSLKLCTFCNIDLNFHSYRRSNQSYGRMFSFVYLL
jgi:hypothetical protein